MAQNFITYGCWNKGYCDVGGMSNGVSAVITEMNVYVSQMAVKPAFVAVAGDNYYPKIDEATETTLKKKYFNETELKSGFACLRDFQRRHNIPIDIIGGNHDTENTLDFEIATSASRRRKSASASASASASSRRRQSVAYKANECLITRTEINMAKSALMSFTMFNCRLFGAGNDTLVLMLDSNIYIENMKKLKDCYLPLLRNTVRHLRNSRMYPAELNVNAFAETIQDAVADFERIASVETLRSAQLAWVNHILDATRFGTIKNVVIVAHHPLAYHKIKKNKMLFQTGADNDGGAKYLKLCQHIYGHFISGQTQFFYSCADLHTYQAGTVVLAAADGASHQIRINQQIAGTGGTTLETEYATIGSLPLQRQGPATTTVDGVDITYDMVVASHSHGFLHWTESTGPENGGLSLLVEFIPVRVRESNDNAGGTRRRRRRGIRSTMLRRQEHRQHHRRKDNRNRTRH
jgi:hypothetical protein